ncbi:MAG: hypothetical protein CMA11_00580 [Euryarchaeota archaeon]|nr:hypothetical protein [Euryarchaeota archaeon]|tara:strand:+ start:1966 stop:2361 length:396 start_codon:yes stop_codon:yes gene_type:complete
MVTNGDSPQPKDDRVISILSNMNNQSKFKKSRTVRQKVADLVANQEVKRLELVVLRRYPRRLVDSANYTGSLAAACGRDETGIVGIILWNNQVKQVKAGDIIRIEDGWCRSRNGELIVSTGRNGTLVVLDR